MSGLHLKRLHIDSDSFIIWCGPDRKNERGFTMIHRPSLGIHIDFPWSEDVRLYDCPKRINLHLWHWYVMIGAKSQVWTRKEGNTERFRWITWHPDHRRLCCREKHLTARWGGEEKEWECGRLRGHRGPHR